MASRDPPLPSAGFFLICRQKNRSRAGLRSESGGAPVDELFDLAVNRVAAKRRIILLLLNALRDRLLVTGREVFGRIFALFAGLCALDDYLFLHVLKLGEGRSERTIHVFGKRKFSPLEQRKYAPRGIFSFSGLLIPISGLTRDDLFLSQRQHDTSAK